MKTLHPVSHITRFISIKRLPFPSSRCRSDYSRKDGGRPERSGQKRGDLEDKETDQKSRSGAGVRLGMWDSRSGWLKRLGEGRNIVVGMRERTTEARMGVVHEPV